MEELVGTNKKPRRRFAFTVYLITVCFMILAITQWLIVNLIQSIADVFKKYSWICVIFFFLAIILFTIHVLYVKARNNKFASWTLSILIVECITIGLFALVVKSDWQDLTMWFSICVLVEYIFILIGILIPIDVTVLIITLYVVAFVFILVSVFWVMLYVFYLEAHYFILYQALVSIVTLSFVIYHAQTITGDRFGEMRMTDYLLASLILFFDFIVLFLLTFYMQIFYRVASNVH